jgi:RNA polymerase sigma-70 factor (ECF subfamily)
MMDFSNGMYVQCESMSLIGVERTTEKQNFFCEEERQIIADVKAGDIDQFEKIIFKYNRYVAQILGRHVPYHMVNELAQDVFLKAFTKLDSFKFRSAFKTWLTKIAYNVCYDYWRKNKKQLNSEYAYDNISDVIERLAENNTKEIDDELNFKAYQLLQTILQNINPLDKTFIPELHLKRTTIKELALKLGISETNIKVRAFRARKFIRRKLSLLLNKDKERNA